MEKGKSLANTELASSLKNLHLALRTKFTPSNSLSRSLATSALPVKNSKPRKLVSLCLGFLGEHFEDIITDISEVAAGFPPDIKLAMAAIARRRRLLSDDVLISLAESSWELLDISGSDVTDSGLSTVAKICTNLHAVDISRCEKVTVAGVSELISHCRSLEILRCGGCPRSNSTACRCLCILKPKLNVVEEESWEELDKVDIGNGAQSLRWLVWPKIDEDSKVTLAKECPRIIVNPQPSPIGFRGVQVPAMALPDVALDHSAVEDIDPKTWAVSAVPRRSSPTPSSSDDAPEMHIAERFRLAFLEREARLAPKRAKKARQQKRRAEREYMMTSIDAKSIALAAEASKFLHKR
uniref:Protein AMN1 homolog n=1 Tax=Ananas comosus var. bracteatus TaxID=296719 RepID=A0A6V7PMF7_ANACO|nr:unnamed protein product [Ananas comosus var. bracteatus]